MWSQKVNKIRKETPESFADWNPMVRPSPKWWNTTTDRSDFTVPSNMPSTHLGIWACGSTWRRHSDKHACSSAPHQRITQPTSWPHVASPTWSSTEQVARPATKRFHPSHWRPLEACCRPWTWWCNDAAALAGYANLMMMMMMMLMSLIAGYLHRLRHIQLNSIRPDQFQVRLH